MSTSGKPFPVDAYVIATNALVTRHWFCGFMDGVIHGTFRTVISDKIFDAMRFSTEDEAKKVIADLLTPAWSVAEMSKIHTSQPAPRAIRRRDRKHQGVAQ